MRLSDKAVEKLKGYETGGEMKKNSKGVHYLKLLPKGQPALKAYLCPAGKWTIGWGHTGPDVGPTTRITLERAEELFAEDRAKYERGVSNLIAGGAPTSQGQFDAMVLLSYNTGLGKPGDKKTGGLANSTLLKLHRAGRYADAAKQFALWNKGRVNGKLVALAGLTERRAEEAAMYSQPTIIPDHFDGSVRDTAIVMASSRSVSPEEPKTMTHSTTIGASIAATVTAVPLTVEGASTVLSGAKELREQATAMDFAWMTTALGVVIMLLTAFLIYKRIKDRKEGIK